MTDLLWMLCEEKMGAIIPSRITGNGQGQVGETAHF